MELRIICILYEQHSFVLMLGSCIVMGWLGMNSGCGGSVIDASQSLGTKKHLLTFSY